MRAAILALLAACSGPDPTTAVSVATARSLCRPICERDVRCNGNVLEDCLDSCADGYGRWVRHDALADLASCAGALACGVADLACHNQIEPLPEHLAWQDACRIGIDCAAELDRTRLCEVDVVADPLAHLMRLAGTDIIAELTECMALDTCARRLSCAGQVERERGLRVP